MKILTVSASPYLLTKLGKLNRSILRSFPDDEVGSAVWHHDPTYFMPEVDENEIPRFYYEEDDKKICELSPSPPLPMKP